MSHDMKVWDNMFYQWVYDNMLYHTTDNDLSHQNVYNNNMSYREVNLGH